MLEYRNDAGLEEQVREQLQSLEQERQAHIAQLGESMYGMWRSNQFSREAFESLCQSIKGCEDGIQACHTRLEELRQERARQLAAQAAQQPQPGPVWQDAPAPSAAPGVVCPCGNLNPAGARFCTKCGHPLG